MKTRPAIGNIEGIDGKFYTSDVDKSNVLFQCFTNEDPNTVPTFNVDKSDDVSYPVLL